MRVEQDGARSGVEAEPLAVPEAGGETIGQAGGGDGGDREA